MTKEKKLNGNTISRRFSTMMPLDVLVDFTEFAKQTTGTGLGKFDYGVALRILLSKVKLSDRLDDLEQYIAEVESKIINEKPKVEESTGPKTFGTKSKEVNK